MFQSQIGLRPKITFLIGFSWAALWFFIGSMDVYGVLAGRLMEYQDSPDTVFFRIIMSPIFVILGFAIANIYPRLKATRKGIGVMYLPFLDLFAPWNEIIAYGKYLDNPIFSNTYLIILRKPTDRNTFADLVPRLHGRFFLQRDPVIAISAEMIEIIQEIKRNTSRSLEEL